MDKVYCGQNFVNIEVFEKFLEQNAKKYNPLRFERYLDDLIRVVEETGSSSYELKSFETFSNHPECIYFEVIQPFYEEGEINILPAIIVF